MSHPTIDNTDCRAAIEKLPHLAEKMCALWSSRELDTFIHSILMDSREGKRQGLPVEVAKEMMFIAKLNALVRAMDTASRLQISLGDATRVVQEGDRIALGQPSLGDDPWSENVLAGNPAAIRVPERKPDGKPADRSPRQKSGSPAPVPVAPLQFEGTKVPAAKPTTGKGSTMHYMSMFLNEVPPIPPLVRLDLTSPETARAAASPNDMPPAMSSEFFRCIAREIRSSGVDELVLSHLGCARQCTWVVDAIRFAKQHCSFPQVHLRVDPMNASDQQLEEAILAGLDCLALDLNMACKSWRARAQEKLSEDPNYFALRLTHLLQKREEIYSKTLHRCIIKVSQTGKTIANHALSPAIAKLAGMADAFSVDWLPDLHDLMEENASEDGKPPGGCLCWAPFVEAYVRPNGHLVVCAHDSHGSSFVADLKRTEFADAWHSEAFRRTRHGLLNGTTKGTLCSSCPRTLR